MRPTDLTTRSAVTALLFGAMWIFFAASVAAYIHYGQITKLCELCAGAFGLAWSNFLMSLKLGGSDVSPPPAAGGPAIAAEETPAGKVVTETSSAQGPIHGNEGAK
jgi:hypothetical protein